MVAAENVMTIPKLDAKIAEARKKSESVNDDYLKMKLEEFIRRCNKAKEKITKYYKKLCVKHPALKGKTTFLNSLTVSDTQNYNGPKTKKMIDKVEDPIKESKLKKLATFASDHKGMIAATGYTTSALLVAEGISVAINGKSLATNVLKPLFNLMKKNPAASALIVSGLAAAGITTLLLKLPKIQQNMQRQKMARLQRQNAKADLNKTIMGDLKVEKDERHIMAVKTMEHMLADPAFETSVINELKNKLENSNAPHEQRAAAAAQIQEYKKYKASKASVIATEKAQIQKLIDKQKHNEAVDAVAALGENGNNRTAYEDKSRRVSEASVELRDAEVALKEYDEKRKHGKSDIKEIDFLKGILESAKKRKKLLVEDYEQFPKLIVSKEKQLEESKQKGNTGEVHIIENELLVIKNNQIKSQKEIENVQIEIDSAQDALDAYENNPERKTLSDKLEEKKKNKNELDNSLKETKDKYIKQLKEAQTAYGEEFADLVTSDIQLNSGETVTYNYVTKNGELENKTIVLNDEIIKKIEDQRKKLGTAKEQAKLNATAYGTGK